MRASGLNWQGLMEQLQQALPHCAATEQSLAYFKYPKRTLSVNLPVRMDDGKVHVFRGYRTVHSTARGPSLGGVRFRTGVTAHECEVLSAVMTLKAAVADLPLGGGRVRTAHGMLPVPAPATARLLQGFDWRDDGVSGERVTPTGAAILRHLAKGPGRPGGRLEATGSGAGTRELPGMPNILRALVFDTAAAEDRDAGQEVAVLSFDVDDMTGEEIGVAADRLRALDGVLDLALAPLAGKKGRPLTGFRLLVRPGALGFVQERCLLETSTIGLRWRVEQRSTLERSADLSGSDIRVKRVNRPGGATTAKAESDDLTSIDSLAGRRTAKSEAER